MKISAIMPTAGRPEYLPMAIDSFLKQDWPDKELIVLDSGLYPVRHLCEGLPNVVYVRSDGYKEVPDEPVYNPDRPLTGYKSCTGKQTPGGGMGGCHRCWLASVAPIGQLRNKACEYATGEVICHFDSDDFSAPDRMTYQFNAMTEANKSVTGFWYFLTWNPKVEKPYGIGYPKSEYSAAGYSLMYTKEFWKNNKFQPAHYNEDGLFYRAAFHQKQLIRTNGDSRIIASDGGLDIISPQAEMLDDSRLPIGFPRRFTGQP
jgi:glycosyltransferase involved in cell wall biosynthesis